MSRRVAALLLLLAPHLADASPASVIAPAPVDLLPSPPGVVGGAVGGFLNPAAWATGEGEVAFAWDDRSLRRDALDDWGVSVAAPLGFAARRSTFEGEHGEARTLWDYRLGIAGGDRRAHAGVAWRWGAGAAGAAGAEDGLVLGTVTRPGRRISLGSTAFLSAESSFREGAVDVGVRPFGTPLVALFADASLRSDDRLADAAWSAGAEVRPVRGLHLGARLRDAAGAEREVALNVGVTLDRLGVHVLPRYDEDGDRRSTSYLVRATPPHRGLPRLRAGSPRRLAAIDLEDRSLGYRRDRWFDDERAAWLDVVRALRTARDDPSFAGAALNLTGTRLRPSIAWELRREIDGLEAAGKRVVVCADHMEMAHCYVAAGAERVSLDPLGSVLLPGIAFRRTYLRGLLEKAGIGFEEHRLFRYKSAAETFTRRDMSDADREQHGRLADAFYDELRDGIAAGRGLEPAAVDSIVEREAILLPARAAEVGLVDAVERWEDVREWAKGEDLSLAAASRPRPHPDELWGKPPVVAVVYAEGECDVREGIGARAASRHLNRLSRRGDVAAVVLRADSPGGDPLAADLVASGLAALRDEGKPVVVTQGDVAASGGYWISVDADRLLTTPFTITGSIGVISGWAWDEGFGGKAGLSADGVQRGRHADLFRGLRIPLVGLMLPTRNLDASEREVVDGAILALYERFVGKVAAMRELPEETVREIAQGRVWAGGDAVERGLCDEIGGLADALDEARARAGLAAGDEIRIEEFPPRRRFRLPGMPVDVPGLARLLGGPPGAGAADEGYDLRYLRALVARPAQPQLLLPPEDLPAGWLAP
jgi:protease-4